MSQNYAWAAGFIDGEGCFVARSAGNDWRFSFEITQRSERPLLEVKRIFHRFAWLLAPREDYWRLRLEKQDDLRAFCGQIAGHLRNKRREALLMHSALEERAARGSARVGASRALDSLAYAIVGAKQMDGPVCPLDLNVYLTRNGVCR